MCKQLFLYAYLFEINDLNLKKRCFYQSLVFRCSHFSFISPYFEKPQFTHILCDFTSTTNNYFHYSLVF